MWGIYVSYMFPIVAVTYYYKPSGESNTICYLTVLEV